MRKIILTFGLFVCLAVARAEDRPNIVVFLVDDMGLMDTSVPMLSDEKGNPETYPLNKFYRTPAMERLAKHGVRLSQFYAMSVCSPSRASLMTGKTSARHHTTQYIKPESKNTGGQGPAEWAWKGFKEDTVTLPKRLREAGYRTIHAGKAHFGPNKSLAEDPTKIGFDINIAGCSYGQPGSYYGMENFGHGKRGRENRAVPGLEKYHGKDIHLTEALTIEINAEMEKAVQEKKPFFAYMSHYAVHSPFQPDARFAKNYPGADKRKLAFATMIEGMDKSLGDILDKLESLGVAENTLVFFLGDNGTDAPIGPTHGIACAAPLRGKKGTHYEGGMRVPFIAGWAKHAPKHSAQQKLPIAAGTLRADAGAIYDLYPTILKAAGLTVDETIDGVDLAPVLAGKGNDEEFQFLMHFPHQHRSSYFTVYRKGDWKLIYHYNRPAAGRSELFNLAKDPTEANNLAAKQPERLSGMIEGMAKALEDAGAQYVVSKDKKATLKPVVP